MQHPSAPGVFIYKSNVYSYQQFCKYNFFCDKFSVNRSDLFQVQNKERLGERSVKF